MNIQEQFSSSYMRAQDLTSNLATRINAIELRTIGDEDRVVLCLDAGDLPLNKTNAMALAEVFGDETDNWIGKEIELRRETTMYQGKRVPAIRVYAAKDNGKKAPKHREEKAPSF